MQLIHNRPFHRPEPESLSVNAHQIVTKISTIILKRFSPLGKAEVDAVINQKMGVRDGPLADIVKMKLTAAK